MDSDKKQRIYKTIMLIVLVATITFVATTIFLYKKIGGTEKIQYVISTGSSGNVELDSKIKALDKLINKEYIGEVDKKKLTDGAIKGYIEGLEDPYSEYYTKDEMEEVTTSALGSYTGIGIYMAEDTETKKVMVITPIIDSPAEKAGILPGDLITKVDGQEFTGNQVDVCASKIKEGEVGTKVSLEILRNNETLTFDIVRDNVKLTHITSKVLENNIGYLGIVSFDEGTADDFKNKFEELKNQNIKSLIVDLRNNGGGIVDEALKIADMIVANDSTTLITVDKDGKEEIKKSKSSPIIDMNIVVLVNENTASASEILTGIIKDYNKGIVIGTKTYGKGVIQELMKLSDGTGIKLTTNKYLTPNRNEINKVGIIPDEEVNLPDDVKNPLKVEENKDTQLKRAIEILNNKN